MSEENSMLTPQEAINYIKYKIAEEELTAAEISKYEMIIELLEKMDESV